MQVTTTIAPTAAAPEATAAAAQPADGVPLDAAQLDSAAPGSTTIGGVTQSDTAPRNASPVVEPTFEQWAHLYAIKARLSPREATIAQAAIVRMTPEMRAQWLAELSALSVEAAVEVVRSMIPKPPPKPARGKKVTKGDSQEEG